MEPLRFSTHVFAAAIQSDLILFDSLADRYLSLPGSLVGESGVEIGLVGVRLIEEAAPALVAAGLVVTSKDAGVAKTPLSKPQQMLSIVLREASGASVIDCWRLASAVRVAARRLRHGLPCGQFVDKRRPLQDATASGLVDAVQRLREARLFVPHPRRCLPASVAAADFLRRLGYAVDIVFAVRSHPFEAHCWIEAGGIVLDDDLDKVRAFTPIAVGLL